ncbi:MAG: MFS transporter [Flavobacteriales bacterium]|nr:MAG: MFS transporter [Flavobacteriales bacterium]
MSNHQNNKSIKNNPQIMKAWAFYDWANSVYSLVITTTIFPIYYARLTTYKGADGEDLKHMISILGTDFQPDAVYGFSLMISFLIVVIISPILSSLADIIGNKKSFLQFFAYLGATSCMGLAMFTGVNNIFLGLLFSITASVGFWGSLVFYNSFLPDIATPDRQDTLSARGYIYGYVGSVILVLICLGLIIGLGGDDPQKTKLFTRISFLLTGAWWFGFAQYTFKHLPQFGEVKEQLPKDLVLLNHRNIFKNHRENGGFFYVVSRNLSFYKDIVKESYKELLKVKKELFASRNLKFYLSGFFFYSVGMQTIFLMSTLFGSNELHLEEKELIITLLIIQVIAIVGSLIFSRLSKKIGNINVISISLLLWIGACLSAYFLNTENPYAKLQFYGLAGLVGLVMGGLQAMSRSTYSKLLPQDSMENTTYFSFYDILEKIAIVIGMLIFSSLIQKYGGMRVAMLSMSIFFLLGLILTRNVKMKK